ncbi:MAG: aminoacyl-tRNA hydrolase [Oscillospiraceae bacterium]|jgi:PTH1 family peptidyl-tRNA hydrolase|nr:aminoacyl-tRNA hydrolase [Oscillospiraceae bacterium]
MIFLNRLARPQTDALILGLGNPGMAYARTRHNAGFDALDACAQKTGIAVNRTRSRALTGSGVWRGKRIALAKPQTYMNDSGGAAAGLVQWYKPGMLIVIYDDIDLPLGGLRVRGSGSAGTHNGMRSIITQMGGEDFPRVRVGVGKPPPEWDLKDWVLSRYPDEASRNAADEASQKAADAALMIVTDGAEQAMARYNRKHIGV